MAEYINLDIICGQVVEGELSQATLYGKEDTNNCALIDIIKLYFLPDHTEDAVTTKIKATKRGDYTERLPEDIPSTFYMY